MDANMKVNVLLSYVKMYEDLVAIPFYKTEDGYRYAAFLLEQEDHKSEIHRFFQRLDYHESTSADKGEGLEEQKAVRKLFGDALERLSAIKVSDEAVTAWTAFQKEQDGVLEYHQVLEQVKEGLALIVFEFGLHAEEAGYPTPAEHNPSRMVCHYWKKNVTCIDRKKVYDDLTKERSSSDIVLNHNNPFADISIKEQQFIYGSIMGQFETLGLSTSRSVTKVPKDTEKSYIVMQPGFKIKKAKTINEKKTQDVLFDDTMTTEIAQKDNNIYIYLD